jgi:hypothetical protein
MGALAYFLQKIGLWGLLGIGRKKPYRCTWTPWGPNLPLPAYVILNHSLMPILTFFYLILINNPFDVFRAILLLNYPYLFTTTL